MDVDPLSDTVPPRHAIESDDEDEFNPLSPPQTVHHDLEIEIIGPDVTANNVIVAAGDAGRAWARIANLGQQVGAIAVNKKLVGMLFRPIWTDATIVISEAFVRLPVWAMHGYADFVLEHMKPIKLVMLDAYSVPGYIGSEYVPLHKAPIRYLSAPHAPPPSPGIKLFAPPNLIQSTSASFLSLFLIKSLTPGANGCQATLFLLPSPQAPPRSVGDIISDQTKWTDEEDIWPTQVLRQVHSPLVQLIGGEETELNAEMEKPSLTQSYATRNYMEGNMYI